MATKKKAAKKSTASKKASPKKKSSKFQTTDFQQSLVTSSSEESFAHEEEIQPSMPPVYTSSSQASQGSKDEDSSSSMLKYLVLAALILVGVIAYSVFSKKESYKPEKTESSIQEAEKKSPSKALTEKAEGSKSVAPERSKETVSSGFQGFAISRIVEGKTYAEAVEYCKSIGLRLPSGEEMKKVPQSDVPSELQKAVIWVGDSVSGRNLRYVFETNKNLYTDPKTKLKVLCKE